jgi:hypothetical protein
MNGWMNRELVLMATLSSTWSRHMNDETLWINRFIADLGMAHYRSLSKNGYVIYACIFGRWWERFAV